MFNFSMEYPYQKHPLFNIKIEEVINVLITLFYSFQDALGLANLYGKTHSRNA